MLELEFEQLLEKKNEACWIAENNCQRLKSLFLYGVPSVDDRLPSASSSVIAMPSGTISTSNNKIIRAITDEKEDYDFISKMENIIYSLKDPYKTIFENVYIKLIPIRDIFNGKLDGIANENVYKILKNGYLRIVLLDTDIDFSRSDLMIIERNHYQNKKNKKAIKDEVKIKLNEIEAYVICNKLEFDDELNYIENQLSYEKTLKISYLFTIVQKLPKQEKRIVIAYMRGNTKRFNKTNDYYTFERALLTIGLLHHEIEYGFIDFETDLKLSQNKYVKKYLSNLRNFQTSLNI